MVYVAVFGIAFLVTFFIWVVVLIIYSTMIESFDFGYLPAFLLKSVILVTAVVLVVMFVPFGGLLSLLVWAVGLMTLFRMDAWGSRILVMLIWAVNFVASLAIRGILANMANGSA
jgi:hypothetical protein